MRVAGMVVIALAATAGAAQAQTADVPALIQLIEKQPAGTDRLTWKEQRRDAAKKLGASKDKRAVPVLIELVETETFDIIGEIAIDGLGKLGDASAVPVLERVAKDQSRDVGQRDAAKKALARLNAPEEPPPEDPPPDDGTKPDDVGVVPGGSSVGGGSTDAPSGDGPSWDDDVLGATEQLTLAFGTASFGWDSVRRRTALDIDAAGHFLRTIDKDKAAWRYGADAGLLVGVDNPEGRQKNILVLAGARGHGEFRAYAGPGVYGVGYGAMQLEASRLTVRGDDASQDESDKWYALDLQVAIGGGYGRVLDVGTRARVARIASALERGRALGRPIDDSLARRLQSAWWGLRGELGSHGRLTTTVRILRDAGVLLGEPDASTTYELLEILDDPAFDGRASGMDVDVAFGEGYLKRSRSSVPDPNTADFLSGRVEELLLRARFARQLGDESDASAGLLGRKRLFAGDGVPAPWSVGVTGQWRKFVYGSHYDPTGVLDVGAVLGISDDDRPDTNAGLRVGGEIGWTIVISRASSIRISGDATVDAGELFIGARVEAAYGFLDSAFATSLDGLDP